MVRKLKKYSNDSSSLPVFCFSSTVTKGDIGYVILT